MKKIGFATKSLIFLLTDFFAEGKDGGDGQFEVLGAPGDADDRDAEDQAEDGVENGDFPPAEEDPEEVHHDGEATGFVGFVDQFVAEGPECVAAELEELDAEGDADDRDAHHEPHKEIHDGDQDAAEDEPEKVADCFHRRKDSHFILPARRGCRSSAW